MDLYFSSTAGVSTAGDTADNWFEDLGFTLPHGYLPTTGDNANFWEGTCTDYSFTCDAVDVRSGATLTNLYSGQTLASNQGIVTSNAGSISTNASGGVVTTNYGSLTTNSGTVTTNASGGIVTTNAVDGTITTNASGGTVTYNIGTVTTNNGNVRIGRIVGGSGTLSAVAATDLSGHTAGANVTLPSGGGLVWW